MREAAESCLEVGRHQVGLLQHSLARPHRPLALSLVACFSGRAPREPGFLSLGNGQRSAGSAFELQGGSSWPLVTDQEVLSHCKELLLHLALSHPSTRWHQGY